MHIEMHCLNIKPFLPYLELHQGYEMKTQNIPKLLL